MTDIGTDAATIASIAHGRAHGYYRLLFDAGPVDVATFAALAGVSSAEAQVWLDEQLAAGVLRPVLAPEGDHHELLLPGEQVPILVDDDGERLPQI